jgi:CheY-like chemotaxis protein
MDGLQTLVKLREKNSCRQTPVVFMTARIQQAEKQQYFDAGAVAVIEKPFEATQLGDELAAIYQRYLLTLTPTNLE